MHGTGFNFSAVQWLVVEFHTNDMPFFKQFSILSANPQIQRHTTDLLITLIKKRTRLYIGLALYIAITSTGI